ncbi:MAG: galactokinase [Eubacteriales bacterium]|jgi:galactokinase
MNINRLIETIETGGLDDKFTSLYPGANILDVRRRYLDAAENFLGMFGSEREVMLFSVPGRSELSGNHTDHNRGCVIASSVDLDIIAIASPRPDRQIRLKSEGLPQNSVDIDGYTMPDPAKFGNSDSLIAGMCAGFSKSGYAVGGFDAYTTSTIPKGAGLSSSAAFEVMVGTILSHLYNSGKVDNVEIAKIAQYAENEFFGKPCGLMDQIACAVGGIVAIDFASPANPLIEQLDFDLTLRGYNLCIVDTRGSHAGLTDEYAAIPGEMKAVATHFGRTYLREVDERELMAAMTELRVKYGDRAVLRALHFMEENKRVAEQKQALREGDLGRYFAGVVASGRSSFCYLQNVYSPKNVREQGLSLALCLAEKYLAGKTAAWRVHGGGFAGSIQAYVQSDDVEGFRQLMDGVFGRGACSVLYIRREGALRLC